jgi:phenylpropionate dioxygenase-like ring-hydroxylating dioxygenase large terminal subunit
MIASSMESGDGLLDAHSTPCEPRDSTYKHKVRQPWYPCREYGGRVFASMGPFAAMPVFPRYDLVEDTGGGVIVPDGTSYGLGGGVVIDCNWLQIYENVMDAFHCGRTALDVQRGPVLRREILLPNIRIVPSVGAGEGEGFERAGHIGWIMPIDDTHTRMYSLLRVPLADGQPVLPPRARHNGKLWAELTDEDHRRMPGDKEAIVSQGPIAIHANEHLAASDQGVIMTRTMLKTALEAVARGEDPAGIVRDPARDVIATIAGNAIVAAARS